MTATVTLKGSVTLDESPGLQTSGIPVTGFEDNNDNDVDPSSLPSAFSTELATLFGATPTYVGAAQSASDLITVTSDGTVTSLGFSQADGTALPVYGSSSTGVASGLSAVDGGAISLFADPTLGNQMVLGVDTTGDIVFALYMQPNSTLTAATVWMAQFEAISNPVTTNPDDPVVLGGLGVAAGASTEFNFNALPSGQNLFGTVGTTSSGLVVIGEHPVLNADGTYTNTSNTINTSQGGGPTTIGVNNQMFDPGEGAYFTFVKNPVANYLAGAPGGLDQNEADDADNIQYTGGTLASTSSFAKISQIQGNSLATMKITAYDINDSPQGQAFVAALGTGTQVNVTAVRVYDASGTKIEDTADLAHYNASAVNVTITNGVATVSGLGAGYKIAWDTSAPHDQVLIEDVAGKFDIGGFGANEATSGVTPLDNVRFEDDGPTIGPIPDSIVDFAAGATVTKSLSGVVGTDPNAAPYTLTDYTASLTVNGVTLNGVLATDAHSVTYWADTNGDTVFGNTGDTAYYKLTLGETGAGSYTFDVLVSPPPANLEFNFNALPSGQNLFGTVGSTSDALVVIGEHPVLKADGTYTNASNTINTSQGGGPTTIGVNNQMFDPGEGAYFTFVKSPVANYLAGAPGGLDQNEADDADNIQYTGGTREVTTAFTQISQIQGNSLATMKLTASDLADSPQGRDFVSALGTGTHVDITAVRVYDATGTKIEDTGDLAHFNSSTVAVSFDSGVATVSGLNAHYKIEWDTSAPQDQVLIEDVAGKFDIGGFGAVVGQPTPDQKLDFVAQVTDGDGDHTSDAFSVGIDGTGIYHDGTVTGVTVV